MSHQDERYATAHGEQLQEAFDELVSAEALSDIAFQEDSRWQPRTLVFAALLWSWSSEKGLTDRFAQAFRILAFVGGAAPPGTSYQGFLKRLRCWSTPLLERLKAEFRRRMREDLRDSLLVEGWLLLAGDGSRTALPRTRSNQERFASPKAKRGKPGRTRRRKPSRRTPQRRRKQAPADRAKKAETPQVWLTVLHHVLLGLPWDWRSGPSGSSEREHVLAMARELPSEALLTMDAGFWGYEFWKTLTETGVAFVSRVGGNVKLLRDLGEVRCRGNLVFVWPDQARRRRQPPLVLRLEVLCGGKEPVYLVTNVLEEKRLPRRSLAAIYAARWGVELFYRDFKQTFERGKLRSKAAENAQLELDWSLLGLWAMGLSAARVHAAAGLAPDRRSPAHVLRAFRRPMQEFRSAPQAGEDWRSLVTRAIKDEYQRTSSKTSRDYPRKKHKPNPGAPEIAPATPEQIKAARELQPTQRTAA